MTQNINPVTSSGLSVNSNKLENDQTNYDDEATSKENSNSFIGAASLTPKGK